MQLGQRYFYFASTKLPGAVLPSARQTAGGYEVRVVRPAPFARYLLLVRDQVNPQWRASGYFSVGTNNESVLLHADARGLMAGSDQRPITMPEVRFLTPAKQPEFTCGSGEDSDGDGLPDIYEVLVTQTEPNNADTGNTGILDGYKDLDGDGWSNLEEFRRRTNPLHPETAPAPVELRQPTWTEIMRATMIQTDLPYETKIEIKMSGQLKFQPSQEPIGKLFQSVNTGNPSKPHGNFDLRIIWQAPDAPLHRPLHWL